MDNRQQKLRFRFSLLTINCQLFKSPSSNLTVNCQLSTVNCLMVLLQFI
ncbi:hypothetical protein [Microcoleus sp. CAWBG58]|nr:hypothetical protein [Microcoleus sp. CAWBG58]